MIKLILKFSLICSFVFSSVSQAGPISSDLDGNSYVTYNGIDFAWASTVNSQFVFNGSEINELLAPTFHQGWDYASPEELAMLTALPGLELLELFTNDVNGSFIHAFDYWNTVFSSSAVKNNNIIQRQIASDWVWSIPNFDSLSEDDKLDQALLGNRTEGAFYDTIYVRSPSARPVPEPSTLLIFAIALIALASRKKLLS